MASDEWLDRLIEHEVLYTSMIARCERTEHAWFLSAPEAPDFRDGNRAVRLRAAGASADTVVREVIDYYRDRGLPPTADIDPISESEGFVGALQRAGMTATSGDRLLMRYAGGYASSDYPPLSNSVDSVDEVDSLAPTERRPPGNHRDDTRSVPATLAGSRKTGTEARSTGRLPITSSPHHLTIEIVPNETGNGEAAEWIETAVADDLGYPDEALWRLVARYEAMYTKCRLYLARVEGVPAGTCDLFEANGWSRIDSVVTRKEYRRLGVASALIARAVSDSVTHGNSETYLFTEHGGIAERLYRRLGFAPWHLNLFRQYRAMG